MLIESKITGVYIAGLTADSTFYRGPGSDSYGSITYQAGEKGYYHINLSPQTTVGDVLNQIKAQFEANGETFEYTITNGHIEITSSVEFKEISDSDFMKLMGLGKTEVTFDANYTRAEAEAVSTSTITGANIYGMKADTVFSGIEQGNVNFTYAGNSYSLALDGTETVEDVLNGIKNIVNANGGQFEFSIVDGTITINASEFAFTTDETGFVALAGLGTAEKTYEANYTSGVEYGSNVLTGSVGGLTTDTVLNGLNDGDYTIRQGGQNAFTFNVSSTDTVGDVIDKINASGIYTAGLDSEGRFYIKAAASSTTEVANVSSTYISGTRKVTETTKIGANTVTFGANSANEFTVTTSSNATMKDLIDLINAKTSESGIQASIIDGQFTLTRVSNGKVSADSDIKISVNQGFAGLLTGIADYTSTGPNISGNTMTGSAQDIEILNSLFASGLFNDKFYIDDGTQSGVGFIEVKSSDTITVVIDNMANACSDLPTANHSIGFNNGQIVVELDPDPDTQFNLINMQWSDSNANILIATGMISGTISASATKVMGQKVNTGSATSQNGVITGTNSVKQTHLSAEDAQAQGYILIEDAQDLLNIKNNLSGKYMLVGDIDLSSLGTNFTALIENEFTGILDGNGYTISNLSINNAGSYTGLFAQMNGTVRNLTIENANIKGANYTGILAGKSTGNISNVYVSGTVSGAKYVGGLVGYVSPVDTYSDYASSPDSYITSVGANVTVTGTEDVGGLIGVLTDTMAPGYAAGVIISNAYSTGRVQGETIVGGLVGSFYGDDSVIQNTYSTSSVGATASGGVTGAVVGKYSGDGTIKNSYFAVNSSSISTGTGEYESSGVTRLTNSSEISQQAINSGWSPEIWDFTTGSTPVLKELTNTYSKSVSAGTVVIRH